MTADSFNRAIKMHDNKCGRLSLIVMANGFEAPVTSKDKVSFDGHKHKLVVDFAPHHRYGERETLTFDMERIYSLAFTGCKIKVE